MNLGEYVQREAVRIAKDAVDRVRSGEIQNLGDMEEFVERGLGQTTQDLLALASGTSSPMIQSLVASMQPAIMQALTDYTPTFAAVSGGMLALAVLLGVWVSNETQSRSRRGGRRR